MLYSYKALDHKRQLVHGQQFAQDKNALASNLASQQLFLLSARRSLWRKSPEKPRRPQLTDFCFQLAQLLGAGIPLLSALEDLAHGLDNPPARLLAGRVAARVRQGQPVSRAMAGETACFDPVFIGLVQAGEASGQLPVVLERLHQSLSRQDALRAQTQRLLLYPAIAATVVGTASLFLIHFLVPQIRAFLIDSGHSIPWMTQALFTLSDTLAQPQALLGSSMVFSLLLGGWLRSRQGRRQIDRLTLQLPIVGPLRLKVISTRLADSFALLYAAGIPVLDALRHLQQLSGSPHVANTLGQVRQRIENGTPLSQAFASSGLFSPLLIRMLQIGEHTGQLDLALGNLADRQRRELDLTLAKVQTLIEPAMTISLGLVLGWIMLALLQPIYTLVGQFQP
jgi:type IV pilus assembly protein PilC